MSSSAALHTASHAPKACVYCENLNHNPETCSEYSVSAWKDKLKKFGKCFACLEPKHIANFCRIKVISCIKFRRKHHLSICEQHDKQPDVNNKGVEDSNTSSEAVVSSVSSTVKPKADGQTTVLVKQLKCR